MKIISEDTGRLVATDKAYSLLVVGPVFIIIGAGVIYLGIHSAGLVAALIGSLFALSGVAAIATRKVRTFIVDKTAGQATFIVKSLLKSRTYPYPLASISKLQLVTNYVTTTNDTGPSSGRNGISFGTSGIGVGNTSTSTTEQTRLLLVLQDGTTVDLSDGQRSMQGFGLFSKVANQAVGQKLAAFLGVPFEQVGAGSIGQMVQTVKQATQTPSVVPDAPPTTPPPASSSVPAAQPTVTAPAPPPVPVAPIGSVPPAVPAAPVPPAAQTPEPSSQAFAPPQNPPAPPSGANR